MDWVLEVSCKGQSYANNQGPSNNKGGVEGPAGPAIAVPLLTVLQPHRTTFRYSFKFRGKRHTYKRLRRVHSYLACVLCEHMLVWELRKPDLFPSVIARARAECNCACADELTRRAHTSGKYTAARDLLKRSEFSELVRSGWSALCSSHCWISMYPYSPKPPT